MAADIAFRCPNRIVGSFLHKAKCVGLSRAMADRMKQQNGLDDFLAKNLERVQGRSR